MLWCYNDSTDNVHGPILNVQIGTPENRAHTHTHTPTGSRHAHLSVHTMSHGITSKIRSTGEDHAHTMWHGMYIYLQKFKTDTEQQYTCVCQQWIWGTFGEFLNAKM